MLLTRNSLYCYNLYHIGTEVANGSFKDELEKGN